MKEVTVYEVRETTKTMKGEYWEFRGISANDVVPVRNAEELALTQFEIHRRELQRICDDNGTHYYVVSPQLEKLGFNVSVLRRELEDVRSEAHRAKLLDATLKATREVNCELVEEIDTIRNASVWQRIKWVFTGVNV